MNFWATIDPKLKYSLIVAAVSWLIVKVGFDLDADTSALISLIAGAVAGYQVPNQGSVLRFDN